MDLVHDGSSMEKEVTKTVKLCHMVKMNTSNWSFLIKCNTFSAQLILCTPKCPSNAAVNGHLELPLLKDRQRFDAVSTSNLEVLKFRDWWILTYFIFGHGESSLNNFWSMVNLERTCVLLFYYFLCLKANLDLEKNKSAWWIFTQLYFCYGESWPNYFGKEVNWWWILT